MAGAQALPFGEFFAVLRARGFTVTIEHHLRVARLLERTGPALHPHRLQQLLGPIFAKNADEQEAFQSAFESYFGSLLAPVPPESVGSDDALSLAPGGAAPRRGGRGTGLVIAGAALAAAAVILWQNFQPDVSRNSSQKAPAAIPAGEPLTEAATLAPGPSTTDSTPAPATLAPATPKVAAPEATPAPSSPATPIPAPSTVESTPAAPGSLHPTPANSRKVTFRLPPPLATPAPFPLLGSNLLPEWFMDFVGGHGLALRSGVVILVFMAFAGLEWTFWRRRRLLIERARKRRPPFSWPVRVTAQMIHDFQGQRIADVARQLRRRQAGDTEHLDIWRTIRATIRASGLPRFVYQRGSRMPEYLVLIECTSPRDHQSAYFEQLASALAHEGVFLAQYYYRGDPRICWDERASFSLADLRLRHPDHRLVVLGDGAGFLDPLTGDPAAWVPLLLEWREAALLTAHPVNRWGLREETLETLLPVMPARLEALAELPDLFDRGAAGASLRTWEDDAPPPPKAGSAVSIDILRRDLGEAAFEWLCACAIYPELQWNLTVFLGAQLAEAGNLLTEETLLRFLRLPWFREGVMPDELRARLLAELPTGRQLFFRRALVELLEANPPPRGSHAADAHAIDIAIHRHWIGRTDRASTAKLPAIAELPFGDETRDYAELRLHEPATAPRLALLLPRRLRKTLGSRAAASVGIGPAVRLLAASLLTLAVCLLMNQLAGLTPATATKYAPFTNSLGMKFVPLRIASGTHVGPRVLLSIWDTRNQDYAVFAQETQREWSQPSFDLGPTYPAVNLSWKDAQEFCQWLSKREGRTYRLPTDAEWSAAAGLGAERGKTPEEKDGNAPGYPWGTAWPPPKGAGNYSAWLHVDNFENISPVGSFAANASGVHDMGGNVWQWCDDWYDSKNETRVLRGGSCSTYTPGELKSSFRNSAPPEALNDSFGFRCVLDLAPSVRTAANAPTPASPPKSAPDSPKPAPEPKFEDTMRQGKRLRDRGEQGAAITQFRTAAELDAGNAEPKGELALAYEKMGLKGMAVEQWQQLLGTGDVNSPFYAMAQTKMAAVAETVQAERGFSSRIVAATKDEPFVNSIEMEFVPVPITGGPSDGEQLFFSAMDTRVSDYEIFAKETNREWSQPDSPDKQAEPAVNVSWEDAKAFCAWLTDRERKAQKLGAKSNYRLPTDHEWSCAAGIGEREDAAKLPREKDGKITDAFPWGKEWPPPKDAGNYAGEELSKAVAARKYPEIKQVLTGYQDEYEETAPVGSFNANDWGLYDMGGNVWQWCEDLYDKNTKDRVLRGASWANSRRGDMLSSSRSHGAPGEGPSQNNVGFRCVLDVAPQELAAAETSVADGTPTVAPSRNSPGNAPNSPQPMDGTTLEKALLSGRQLREQGALGEAIVEFQLAASLKPGNPTVIAELAMTYEKMGLEEKALEQWQRVIETNDTSSPFYSMAKTKLATAKDRTTPAANEGIAVGATLGLSQITVEERPGADFRKRFILHIPIKARPGTRIDVKDLVIQVPFYDIIDAKNVVITNANISQRWATSPVDWSDTDTEELAVDYQLPEPDPNAAQPNEKREYFGYVVRIYYHEKLQASAAQPKQLAQQFPPPIRLPANSAENSPDITRGR